MPFDGASSVMLLDKDIFLPGNFQKGSENRERTEEYGTSNEAGLFFFYKEIDSRDLEKPGRIALV